MAKTTAGGPAAAKAYFSEQSADKRALLEELHGIVMAALPDAEIAIKWGVPMYQRAGRNVCALASFKEFVAINLFADPKVLADPKKRLEGAGKTSRMLKVRTKADIDRAAITRWVKVAGAAS